MGIRDEVFERLKNGEDASLVRADYRSQSEVTAGFRLYEDWLAQRIQEDRKAWDAVKESRAKEEAEVKHLRLEKQELSKDVKALRTEKGELHADVQSLREELEQIRSGIEKYREQGFDRNLFLKLQRLDGKTGAEVWSILEDVDKVQKLREDIASIQNRVGEANCEIGLIEDEHRRMEKNVVSIEKKLRRLKVHLAVYREICDVVNLAIRNGMKQEEISELLECLSSVKNLLNLREDIRLAEIRLAEVLRLEDEAKARSKAFENKSLKAIEDERDVGSEAIRSVAMKVKSEVSELLACFREELPKEVKEIALLTQQEQQLRNLIAPAQVLIGVLESPDALRLVPVPLVVQLLERLSMWGEVRFAGDRVSVHFDLGSGELHASANGMWFVRISSLIRLTTEVLMSQLNKSDSQLKNQKPNKLGFVTKPEGG